MTGLMMTKMMAKTEHIKTTEVMTLLPVKMKWTQTMVLTEYTDDGVDDEHDGEDRADGDDGVDNGGLLKDGEDRDDGLVGADGDD